MRRLGVRVPPSAPRSRTCSAQYLDAGRLLAVPRDLAAVVDAGRRALAQVGQVAVGPPEGVERLEFHRLTVAHDHRVVVHAVRGGEVDAEVTEVGDGAVAEQAGV